MRRQAGEYDNRTRACRHCPGRHFRAIQAIEAEIRPAVLERTFAMQARRDPRTTVVFIRIGQRNRTMLRKILWKNGIRLSGEAMGGDKPRTMFMELATGKVVIAQGGAESVLWSNSRAA